MNLYRRTLKPVIIGLSTLSIASLSFAESYQVEAEKFTLSGGTYNDGKKRKVTPINIAGLRAISYVNPEDYIQYTINGVSAGDYDLSYNISNGDIGSSKISVQIKQSNTWQTVAQTTVPVTAWDDFQPLHVGHSISLPSGKVQLRLLASGTNISQWNLDSFVLTNEISPSPEPSSLPSPEPSETPTPYDGVNIDVNFDTRHQIGGIDTFDRRKYINIAETFTSNDWYSVGTNESEDLISDFLEGYDVYFGRDTGTITSVLKTIAHEDPAKPGFADPIKLTQSGNNYKKKFTNRTEPRYVSQRRHEHRGTDMIVAAQLHPFWPDGQLTNRGWALSQTDTVNEPIGTATGDFMGQFLAKYFKQSDSDTEGYVKPKFVEVVNEPLFHLYDWAQNPVELNDVFRFHNSVTNEIRKKNPDVLIGGYTPAFPDYDKNNFDRWESRDRLFFDTAGANMDFISLHLYDFPEHANREKYRKGSNIEATMDMVEHYTYLNNGSVSPLLISEYGASAHLQRNKPWTPKRDATKMKAYNSMLMAFMERPDQILKATPYITLKAEWGRIAPTIPQSTRLMVQNFEREGQTGPQWVYSDMIKFYELWKDVKGTRVDTWSSDQDILVDAYIDGDTAYVILNNLVFEDTEFAFNSLGLNSNNIRSVDIKHMVYDERDYAVIDTARYTELPATLTLGSESTMVLKIAFDQTVQLTELSEESKYYATSYKKPVVANQNISFDINNVSLAASGEAVLRLGVGRDHGLSLMPQVLINGTPLDVPEDFRGYDQKQGPTRPGRENFFGVIEIPVEYAALKQDNRVTITFPDNGGFVTTAALQVFNVTRELNRTGR
ncbi:carbohydrate-binding protein [Agaribacterium sp. ZY112]|uniref:carbohydrate-binding protein n=1 Tax=Agaribacterium sp. ZY112 TaxID=3233574 RepID=UPI00352438CD